VSARRTFTVCRATDTLSSPRRLVRDAAGRGLTVMVKKVLTWGGIAFLIFFVAYRPQSAAEVFKSLGGGIMDIATGFGDFFSSLVA
jgi:hypothetical protein